MTYPNFENKHLEKALFHPKDFLNYHNSNFKDFPKKWMIIWSKNLLQSIRENHKLKFKEFNLQGETYTLGSIGIIKMNGIGSPHAVTNCEEIIAHGGKEFILIGTAGGLKEDGIFICEKSIRDEGTSYHYESHGKYSYPNANLTRKIKTILKKNKIPFEDGISWTIDAPYRETKREIVHYKKEGISTVEMESSALFSLGRFRKVKFAAIFAVSDLLGNEKWTPRFEENGVKNNLNKLIDTILRSKW